MTILRTIDKTGSLGLLLVLTLLIIVFGLLSENFISVISFTTLANQLPTLTVIAVGMTFVLIIAGIDLSVGSVMALCGAVMGTVLINFELSVWTAVILCLLTGMLCGYVNGFISTRWSVPSFIVTLGMLEIARGGAYLLSDSQTIYIGASVETLSQPLPYQSDTCTNHQSGNCYHRTPCITENCFRKIYRRHRQ